MTKNIKEYEIKLFQQILSMINQGNNLLSKPQIKDICQSQWEIIEKVNGLDGSIILDLDRIVERINRTLAVTGEDSTIINLMTQHREWLSVNRNKIEEGFFWNNFKKYQQQALGKDSIKKLDAASDKILGSIEDPKRPGPWRSKGLVIGDVQSGKTTNFLGVIAKALDVGYDLVIVLAGMHESLRTQTQKRFEEGITGYNSDRKSPSPRCGVAHVLSQTEIRRAQLLSWTTREDRGDILISSTLAGFKDETFSVNKKTKPNLENLINHIKRYLDADTQHRDKSVLIIDDEADNASINTKKPGQDPSTINRLIRELLGLFDKTSYIAYTATPFANAFMDPLNKDDLFPRNFISVLGRANNYIGPKHIFGMVQDEGLEEKDDNIDPHEFEPEYNWFRNIDDEELYARDWEDYIPDGHSKEHQVTALPESLKDAIVSFIISMTIRYLRGDKFDHGTMLIHVTRYKAVQARISELANDFTEELYGELAVRQFSGLSLELKVRIERVIKNNFGNINYNSKTILEATKHTLYRLRKNVLTINGDAKDVVDEEDYPNGLISIRIGGDKLSRGLTLPGLTTSYFLRTTRMYDTLMQMGRWFGYRDGYDDLCHIFTTGRLYNWYSHIALASENLRSRITTMNNRNLSPMEYQQQIQSHPGMMLVTAINKQYNSRSIKVSFANSYVECNAFDVSDLGRKTQKNNLELVKNLICNSRFPIGKKEKGNTVFRNINVNLVSNFINNFEHLSDATGIWQKKPLSDYILKMTKKGELTNWTVVLYSVSSKLKREKTQLGQYSAGALQRKNYCGVDKVYTLKSRNLTSANDERLDLSEAEIQEIKDDLIGDQKLKRENYRLKRDPKNGLLIIYLLDASLEDAQLPDMIIPTCAISFPATQNSITTEFKVNMLEDVLDEPDENDDE